jgi:nucleoside-specific outer membrane channel protein Tsx
MIPTKNALRGAVVIFGLFMAGMAPAQDGGYSSWNMQGLYGGSFDEPFNSENVGKLTATIENSAGWSWGSSYFFADVLNSTKNDGNAAEIYSEWYPSASFGKMSGKDLSAGAFKDISLTMGINAGRKSTGASPLVFLPGLTMDFKLPGFAFASLGLYAYIDEGELDGESNGCHETGFQATPSWLLPFPIGKTDWQFGGFIDYISSHGNCAEQFLTQAQLTMDVGKATGHAAGKFYVGMEYLYWNNKFGIDGAEESSPQVLMMYKF